MWHLKTKFGTFWIVETPDKGDKCFLGVDDHELGLYNSPDAAAKGVHEQATGYLDWDIRERIKAPETVQEWDNGQPGDW